MKQNAMKNINPRPQTPGRPGWIALRLLAACAVLLLPLAASAADSNPPDRLTYQSFLVDANGLALGNSAPKNYDVVFRIFAAQTGGVAKWTEQQTITVDKGYFSVLLGEGAQVASDLRPPLSQLFTGADASDRYVEITVKGIGGGGSDSTITPRLRLLTSPYAFLARNATALVSQNGASLVTTANGALTVNGSIAATSITGSGAGLSGLTAGQIPNLDASKITSGTLADARIPNLAGTKITSGTVADARLSSNVALRNSPNTFTQTQNFIGDMKAFGNLSLEGGSSRVNINTPANTVATITAKAQPGDAYLLYLESSSDVGFFVRSNGDAVANGNIQAVGNITANGKSVAVGEETLRIVRGIINLPTITTTQSAGEKGTGYTVQKVTVAGVSSLCWRIRFTQSFLGVPSCTANSLGQFDYDNHIAILEATSGYVTLASVDNDGTLFQDNDKISFIVVGPR